MTTSDVSSAADLYSPVQTCTTVTSHSIAMGKQVCHVEIAMQLGGSDCSNEQQRWIRLCKSLLGVARHGHGQRVMQLYPFACLLQRIPCR